jgi:hypothetical protein
MLVEQRKVHGARDQPEVRKRLREITEKRA